MDFSFKFKYTNVFDKTVIEWNTCVPIKNNYRLIILLYQLIIRLLNIWHCDLYFKISYHASVFIMFILLLNKMVQHYLLSIPDGAKDLVLYVM